MHNLSLSWLSLIMSILFTTSFSNGLADTAEAGMAQPVAVDARLAVLGDFTAHAVDWEALHEGRNVSVYTVDDFSTRQLGWVVDAFLDDTGADVCIFTGGTIDAVLGISVERVIANVAEIFRHLSAAGVEPLLLLPLEVRFEHPGHARHLDAIRKALAAWAGQAGVRMMAPGTEVSVAFDAANVIHARIERILGDSVDQPGVVMLGDSLTENGANWNERLGRGDVRNAGQGGYTTGQILWLLDERLIGNSVQQVLLTAGINDLSLGIDGSVVVKNLIQICEVLLSRGIAVVVQSTVHQHDSAETNAVIDVINAQLAAFSERRAVTYLDLNERLSGSLGLKAEHTTDGTHLTEQGYAMWAAAIRESGYLLKEVSVENLTLPPSARQKD